MIICSKFSLPGSMRYTKRANIAIFFVNPTIKRQIMSMASPYVPNRYFSCTATS